MSQWGRRSRYESDSRHVSREVRSSASDDAVRRSLYNERSERPEGSERHRNTARESNSRDIFSRVPSPDGRSSRSITPDSTVSSISRRDSGDMSSLSGREKQLVTINFDLPRTSSSEQVYYKATSMGSLHGPTGIFARGLDPSFGGQGGGSGVWEGANAPDRRSNIGKTTLATNLESTKVYAEGFQTQRSLNSQEVSALAETGKLDGKYVGVTLRVRPGSNADVQPDPGSPSYEGVYQTRRLIEPRRIEVQSLTLMLTKKHADALREHINKHGTVKEKFLEQVLDKNYYKTQDMDPRPDWARPASSFSSAPSGGYGGYADSATYSYQNMSDF